MTTAVRDDFIDGITDKDNNVKTVESDIHCDRFFELRFVDFLATH